MIEMEEAPRSTALDPHAHRASERSPRMHEIILALRFAALSVAQSNVPAMAANLAFRALFGLLPVLVLVTLVARAVMGAEFDSLVERVITAVGINELHIAAPDANGVVGERAAIAPWIRQLIADAANVKLSSIGFIGTLVVLFAAVWTMNAIEQAFNAITRAPSGRPIIRRVLTYWFVLTAGPVLFAAIPFLLRTVTQASGGEDALLGRWLASTLALVGSFAALWLLLGFAYIAVPNIRIDRRCAIIGSFIAALLISLGKGALAASLAGSFEISRLYGSLGFVPLFMMWVYLMWLVVLYGLQLSVILQSIGREGRAFAASGDGPDLFEPASAVDVFQVICTRFTHGKATRREDVEVLCGLAPKAANDLLQVMERRKLLLRSGTDLSGNTFVPAGTPAHFTLASALDCGFALSDGGEICTADDAVRRLREAQTAALSDERFR